MAEYTTMYIETCWMLAIFCVPVVSVQVDCEALKIHGNHWIIFSGFWNYLGNKNQMLDPTIGRWLSVHSEQCSMKYMTFYY